MSQLFILAHQEARRRAVQAVHDAPDGMVIKITEPTRNLEQNAAMWASLSDVSDQVDWYGRKLSAEDWKNVFTASLRKLEVVPNLDGTGFVALGQSSSRMTKREFSDLLELINAFAAEHGVVWSDEIVDA
jgi:hypothetical protein